MNATAVEVAQSAVPYIRSFTEDGDLRAHTQRAVLALRDAVRAYSDDVPSQLAALELAGVAIREASQAIVIVNDIAARHKRARQRALLLRLGAVVGAGTVVAVAVKRVGS